MKIYGVLTTDYNSASNSSCRYYTKIKGDNVICYENFIVIEKNKKVIAIFSKNTLVSLEVKDKSEND